MSATEWEKGAASFKPLSDPPGWKSKAKFHEAFLAVGGNKVRLSSKTGNVTLRFA